MLVPYWCLGGFVETRMCSQAILAETSLKRNAQVVADTELISSDLRLQSLDLAVPGRADILRQLSTWAV
jgi:hypothetical protein